jgi:hypothetical protein
MVPVVLFVYQTTVPLPVVPVSVTVPVPQIAELETETDGALGMELIAMADVAFLVVSHPVDVLEVVT